MRQDTLQMGGSPDESPVWIGGHYGGGTDARGLRRRNVKRSAHKGQRRAGHVKERALALDRDIETREHSR